MRLHELFPCWETKGRLRILNICNFAKRQYVNVNESEQCQDKATGFNNRFEGNLELGYSLKSQPLFAFGLIGYSAAAINFEWLTDEIHNRTPLQSHFLYFIGSLNVVIIFFYVFWTPKLFYAIEQVEFKVCEFWMYINSFSVHWIQPYFQQFIHFTVAPFKV